ncbi:MAG: PAS domain-containing sensor histidine kinase [Sandaracinaceae bacterium]
MNEETIFSFVASGMFLALAALTAIRGSGRSPLAIPTAALCVDLWGYNTFEALSNLSETPAWEWIESATAALAAPLLFHLALSFVGQRRAKRRALITVYAIFGCFALSSFVPLIDESLAAWPGGDHWALAFLCGLVPLTAFASQILVRYYRGVTQSEERGRTQLFFAAIGIGVLGPVADLAAIAGAGGLPRIAAPSMALSAALLCALALRVAFLQGETRMLVINAVLIAISGAVAQVIVFQWLGSRIGFLVIGTLVVTALLLAAARGVWRTYAESQERTAQLATLGRLSSQMAHDIKNPLAAIRGAAQYIDEERKRGGELEAQAEFLELILDQTARLDRVVEDYRRLGSATPRLEDVEIEGLVDRVVKSSKSAVADRSVTLSRGSRGQPTTRTLDPELIATALENLVRNAAEAIGTAEGEITVGASVDAETGRLTFYVADDGPGMDARTREQAQDAFFTTKPTGSGLGLAFVRRVAEAHGGEVRIESALGRGTTVQIALGP